jgi:hypothetical protein
MRSQPRPAVHLLDALPDLAAGLSREERAGARCHLRAAVVGVDPGRWRFPAHRDQDLLGLLVLEGVFAHDVSVRGRCCAELLGAGDVIRPWEDADDALRSVHHGSRWDVIEPARLAVLDRRAVSLAARWPPVVEALMLAASRRALMASRQLAITQVPGVDVRVHLMLWELADRWGKVTAGGVALPIALTHALLGRLVGAQRQSVTSAVRRLRDEGLVQRSADGGWVLRGAPDEIELEHASTRAIAPVAVAA